MKPFECEIDRNAPYTPFEKASAGVIILGLVAAFFAIGSLCGCRAFYENSGSKVNVGTLTAPVEVSDSSDTINVRALYSMDGAAVWTAKDSLVKITYRNAYTNNYFAIVKTTGEQDLSVEIEPLAVEEPYTNATCRCPLAVPATNTFSEATDPITLP